MQHAAKTASAAVRGNVLTGAPLPAPWLDCDRPSVVPPPPVEVAGDEYDDEAPSLQGCGAMLWAAVLGAAFYGFCWVVVPAAHYIGRVLHW